MITKQNKTVTDKRKRENGCSFMAGDFESNNFADNTPTYTDPGNECPYHSLFRSDRPTNTPTMNPTRSMTTDSPSTSITISNTSSIFSK